MIKSSNNPFRYNPEQVLQDRLKRGRRITREEFFKSAAPQKPAEKKVDE